MRTFWTRAAIAVSIVAATGTLTADPSTLEWPTGQHAWIGVRADDLMNEVKAHQAVYDDIVSAADAAWIRIHFGAATRLDRGSFIRITSLRDGEVQELDAEALNAWHHGSAYFNGNSVRVQMFAGGLTFNALAIDTVSYERVHVTDRGDGCGICGSDDRVASDDDRFARIMPTGCSATMYNTESCYVTAGHCISGGDVLQHNVPLSNSNCSTNQPPVADQFPYEAYDGVNGGVGNDYGAIKAGTNGNGETPYARYGVHASIGSVPSSGTLTVNGYGVDDQCTASQTQQFCDGPMLGSDSTAIWYNLDVTFGNSGSSLLYNGEIVGVVTHCSYSCENYGTRIDRSGFATMRDNVCDGGGGGGGDCPSGEIEDCNGNCCPADWVGDGYCDDGSYTWNGNAIYLNCDQFDCDAGDCECDGDPTGGCCVGDSCSVVTAAECDSAGGSYLGDGSDCSGDPCSSGGCPSGEIEDCNGNCCPADWVGDGFCDDGTYTWNGIPIYLNCDQFDCDAGDCDCGGGDPTGGCCVGDSCSVVTAADCAALGGSYLGDGSDCSGDPCSSGGGDGDTCADAVTAAEGANAFDTSTQSDSGYGEPDDTQCADTYLDWSGSQDFWFVWNPGADGAATFSTCDTSSYDTSMVIYEGTSCSNLQQIACNGDYPDSTDCQSYHSQIDNLQVSAGQSYYIRLGGWLAAAGPGTLTIDADLGQPLEGACCFSGGTCDYITSEQCANSGGAYQGDGVPCSPNPCEEPAQGACCLETTCFVSTQIVCQDSGGQYQGDGTDCTNDPCGSDLGACCIGSTCHQYSENECNLQSGTWYGVGSSCNPNPCDVGESEFAIGWTVVGVDLTDLDQPHYTVDVHLEMPDGWRLDAVAGNSEQLKTIVSSTTFYQNGYGGPTSLDVNPGFYDIDPSLEWDSRMGIGAIDSSGSPFGSNDLNHIGIDWEPFEAGGDVSADNGVWFIIPDDPAGGSMEFTNQDCDNANGVWIGRLTTMELSSEIMVDALFQGRDGANDVWQEAVGETVTYQGEVDCNGNHVPDACDIANGTSEDANGNGIPDECDGGCDGDVDGDGDVDVDDVLAIINGFGTVYDVDDLLNAIANFGCTG